MKIAAALVVVVLIASLVLIIGASATEKQKEERKFQTIDKIRDDLVDKTTATFLVANETATTIPCYPVPYSFCAGCAMGCSNTCYYTGSPPTPFTPSLFPSQI
jgi:hypothetical protein